MTSGLFLKNKILELETRRRIYELVKKNEGSHFRGLERKSKLPGSSLKYHLDYLTRHGVIAEEKNGNTLCYFSHEIENTFDKELLILLRQKSIRNILLSLVMNNQCLFEEIVRFVHLSPSTVSWHLKKLKMKHIIAAEKKGKNFHYTLIIDEQHIINLLIMYQESFLDSLVDKVVEMWDV